jgi:hypothetical protein
MVVEPIEQLALTNSVLFGGVGRTRAALVTSARRRSIGLESPDLGHLLMQTPWAPSTEKGGVAMP